MKKYTLFILTMAFSFGVWAEVQHAFVGLDNRNHQLVYVDELAPETSWRVPVPEGSRDLFLLDDDRVLVSHPDGAGIYRLRDGSSVQTFSGFKDVSSASRTPVGTYLLGSPAGFAEVDESGKTLRVIRSKGEVSHLRLVRMQPNGNILYCAGFSVFEIDGAGEIVWRHKTVGKSYLAVEQADGSIFSTQGGEAELLRITRAGEESLVCGGVEHHPDVNLAWFSGYDLLPNGNVVIANWRGHGFKKASKHLIEFTPGNQIVWSWDDPAVQGITTIQVIR